MSDVLAYTIPADVLNRVGAYLAQRPYAEVAGLLAEVQATIKPVAPPAPDADTPTP